MAVNMIQNFKIIFSTCLILYFGVLVNGEHFTAIADLEQLLETQNRIINILNVYVFNEEKRLASLKKYLTEFQTYHEKAMTDIHTHLSNPVNIFILLKRLYIDLYHVEDYTLVKAEYVMNFTMIEVNDVYPTQMDLVGAAKAISRVQETYKLDVKELAEGKLNGEIYSSPMATDDCYELGRIFYTDVDYTNVCEWMMQAFTKFNEDIFYKFTKIDILEYIIFAYFSMNDMRNALKWTYTLLDSDPNNSRALHNLPLYINRIADANTNMVEEQLHTKHANEPEFIKAYIYVKKQYEALCRGETETPISTSSKLTCRYMSENNAFLKLARIKMEMMNSNPDVIMYHDILSENEIAKLKQIATLEFKDASQSKRYRKNPIVQYHVSKSVRLNDTKFAIADRITRRIADITGLNVESADPLKIINYGIGGHHELHYDTPSVIYKRCTKNDNNKIATVLFYLSEVPLGGATVFPQLQLSLYPVKGAAVLWFNLHPSGERNLAMMHADCPVLLGSKWVCKKLIHTCGQEFIKPCNLVHQK